MYGALVEDQTETGTRELLGLVAAWHRGDDEALRVLRPPDREDHPRAFDGVARSCRNRDASIRCPIWREHGVQAE